MRHSIAARLLPRPEARFVRPDSRAGERRLGLIRADAIRPSSRTPTFLTAPDLAPVTRLHRGGASAHRAVRTGSAALGIAPPVRIHWTRTAATRPALRTGATSASWRA